MFKRKFILFVVTVITAFACFTLKNSFVSADSIDGESVFNSSYIAVSNIQHEQGGYINETNYNLYIEASAPGITVAEQLSSVSKDAIDGFNVKYGELLNVYKKANIVKLGTFYNPDDFSPTENGTILLNNKKQLAGEQIDASNLKSEIDAVVLNFKNEIEQGIANNEFSVRLSYVNTADDSNYKVSVIASGLVFSSDSVLEVLDVKDGILFKNTQIALLENDDVIDGGGVVKYLHFKLIENGVISESEYDEFEVVVNLQSLAITVGDGETLQVAKYTKNQQVEIITAQINDGYLTFKATEFGKYAIVQKGYQIENTSEFVAFFEKHGAIVGVVAGILLILSIIISSAKRRKKKKEKQELKEFRKGKKSNNKKDVTEKKDNNKKNPKKNTNKKDETEKKDVTEKKDETEKKDVIEKKDDTDKKDVTEKKDETEKK